MPALKGKPARRLGQDPLTRTSFRDSYFQPEGAVGAEVYEAVVVDYNLETWTVDCLGKFDQKRFLNVQVGTPYCHPNRGEGIYLIPEPGSKCHICIPSDGAPPYVMDFIMPMERRNQTGSEEAPQGTDGGADPAGGHNQGMTFSGGRARPKPGDIVMRGRDGNFVILHRGGVLQIGATELSQRIFIPLQNIMTDISQNYRHHNTGGSIQWGLQSAPSENNPPTSFKQTFRLFANDEKATMRVAVGTFADIVSEPKDGYQDDINQLELGTEEPIVCEIVVAPNEIEAEDGSVSPDTPEASTFRYFFDRRGGCFMRAEGSIMLATKDRLRIKARGDIELISEEGGIRLEGSGTGRIQCGGQLDISSGVVAVNGGSKPVATVGSVVQVAITVPIPITTSAGAGTINAGSTLTGVVSTGNPTVLA